LVSRPEAKGLGLGLETYGLGLGLGLEIWEQRSWSWSRDLKSRSRSWFWDLKKGLDNNAEVAMKANHSVTSSSEKIKNRRNELIGANIILRNETIT